MKALPTSAVERDRFLAQVEAATAAVAHGHCAAVTDHLRRLLDALAAERIGPHHFSSATGSAHGDPGREAVDRVFARVMQAEAAAVRLQFVSGTHAIAAALFGVLRPGDTLLAAAGRPYETLEEVIGLRGKGQGSLREFGVAYREVPLARDGHVDEQALAGALDSLRPRLLFLQRSCGYHWRHGLSLARLERLCAMAHSRSPHTVCFVDNCYGEFVNRHEPTAVGADLMAGSLVKNPGGTIVPTGGYLAGRRDLVEQACCRLTAPGLGSAAGASFHCNRLLLQGLFLAPQMVAEALIGAELVAATFQKLGYGVNPQPGTARSDVIQAVRLGSAPRLLAVCRAFQRRSPVGAYLEPTPAAMVGYQHRLVMAGGTFVEGSTSEFSADAPLVAPYVVYVQGGCHRSHVRLALEEALAVLPHCDGD